MNLKELQDYRHWIGKSASVVYFAARAAGGWQTVFPHRLPRWASRVRNYFNVFPSQLKRVPEKQATALLKRMEQFKFQLECHEVQSANRTFRNYKRNPDGSFDAPPFKEPAGCPVNASYDVKHTGLTDSIAIKNALSGQVYLDERNWPWYQMAAGSTIYHFGRHPGRFAAVEAIWLEKVRGQDDTPVFKLVSPDGTGGSREVILFNDGVSAYTVNGGKNSVSDVNEVSKIKMIVETDPIYQGSYNYSETAQVGLSAHETRDVKPHVHHPRFYVNPSDIFASLDGRSFPEFDLEGNALASQN